MKTSDLVLGLGVSGSTVTSTSDVTPQNKPGEKAYVLAPEGIRVYKYVKFEEAFAVGQCAMHATLIDNATSDQAQAVTSKIFRDVGNFTANEFNSSYPDAYITIDSGTGAGQTRKILNNRGSTDFLNLDRVWSTALDTTSDYVVYSLNYVSLMDTDDRGEEATICQGVAISAMTANYWGWIQIKGFCPLVRAVGTTDAIAFQEQLVPSDTAGACKGFDSSTDVVDAISTFGLAMHAYAAADSAGNGIAAILDCRYA